MRDQRCRNWGHSGLWSCLLLNIMMPKLCLKRLMKIMHHERPKMPKPKHLLSLMMPTFWCHDAKIMPQILTKTRQHEWLDMSYPSWCLGLDLKMPKIMSTQFFKYDIIRDHRSQGDIWYIFWNQCCQNYAKNDHHIWRERDSNWNSNSAVYNK